MSKEEPINPERIADEIESAIHSLPGMNTAEIRAIRRGFSKKLSKISAKEILKISLSLLGRPGFINRFVAYELICHHREALKSLNAKMLEQLGEGIDSWGAVDTFACYLSGPAWRENQVPDTLIHKWAKSKDKWWRRTAIVSTVPLNNKARGGRGDAKRTLEICEMLIDDRDDMVVKALSWSLRELGKRDAESVAAFMSENEDRLAGRVKREVRNKLSTGLKNPRQRSA